MDLALKTARSLNTSPLTFNSQVSSATLTELTMSVVSATGNAWQIVAMVS
jgi:hypothetical protein